MDSQSAREAEAKIAERIANGEQVEEIDLIIVAKFHEKEEWRGRAGKLLVEKIGGMRKISDYERGQRFCEIALTPDYEECVRDAAGKGYIKSMLAMEGEYTSMAGNFYGMVFSTGAWTLKTRKEAAGAYLEREGIAEPEKALRILGCRELPEDFRFEEGQKLANRAMEAGKIWIVERIGDSASMPEMLREYAKMKLERGPRGPFAKEKMAGDIGRAAEAATVILPKGK